MATKTKIEKHRRATTKAKAQVNAPNSAKTTDNQARSSITLSEAKGRPMLHWVGKKPIDSVQSFPAELVETFSGNGTTLSAPNLLFHGDNKEVLAHLLTEGYRGKVNLVYIDPPFDSKADYVRTIELRGAKNAEELEAEGQGLIEQKQYSDIWAKDTYLQFMYERLILLKELLADNGSILVHCDYRKVHHIRLLMDEVFGEVGFVNEIIWLAEGGGASGLRFARKHQTILYYSKTNLDTERTFNGDAVRVAYKTENIQPQTYHFDSNTKKRPAFKEGYTWTPNEDGKIPTDAWLDCFLTQSEGVPLDVWYDVKGLYGPSGEIFNYPTQKPRALMDRIIRACSNPNDIVLDCFIGSGTTAEVAQQLERRWIACDINKGAIQTTSKRLQKLILQQVQESRQGKLGIGAAADGAKIKPTLSFNHYRINDYDLQIQHNEALELALQHVGVTRTRTDSFFEGQRGKKLVKVVPLLHPCTLLDVQLVENELQTRPEEARDVLMVALGKDANVDMHLAQRNKRKPVNKIELIELRTDPKYGNFFTHQPAWAHVTMQRLKKVLRIAITDFSSPTILQRLSIDETIFRERVSDFRSMIDVVLIDTDYNGNVLNIHHSDVPGKKTDFVKAKYEIPIKPGKRIVAVKIIDMLGEEVLLTKEV